MGWYSSEASCSRCAHRHRLVGTDVDLLILLTQLSSSDNLFRRGSGKYSNNVYNISDIKNSMRGLSNCLLFLHAVTHFDTTSALYRQCTKKAFNLVKHNPELQTLVEMFIKSSSTPDAVVLAGNEFLVARVPSSSVMARKRLIAK